MAMTKVESRHLDDARVRPIRRSVERLIAGIPPEYLAGLEKIVLRDSSVLTPHEKKKRAQRPGQVLLGTYHRGRGETRSYIDLFATEIAEDTGSLRWLSLWADLVVSRVLYHEIGHHIHRHIRPEHRDPETVASEWRRTLTRHYFRRRYWYLVPVVTPVVRTLIYVLKRLVHLIRIRRRPTRT
jgi:hypothetical protein